MCRRSEMSVYFFTQNSRKEHENIMKKILKRLCTGLLTLATVFTALPTTAVHASETQYWTESAERVGIVEKVMNDGSIGSTLNEGHMQVETSIPILRTAIKQGLMQAHA